MNYNYFLPRQQHTFADAANNNQSAKIFILKYRG